MEFGRIPEEALAVTDFTLPADSAGTIETLAASNLFGDLKIHVGCTKWSHKGWIGKIYPSRIKDDQFLSEYARHFNTIEFGVSFYEIPPAAKVIKWKEQITVDSDFTFCPKFPQVITHMRRLRNAEVVTKQFYENIANFGGRLGPLMLQLGDNFSTKCFQDLRTYLSALPTDVPVFVEVRHKDWFQDLAIRNELFGTLRELKIGAVITDAAGRRDCVHMELTTPQTMIRFVGNNLVDSDYLRLDMWVERIKAWQAIGLQSVWFFMHQHDETFSPKACDYLIKKLNEELQLDLKRPGIEL